jgi:hypothetical protein
MKTLRCDTHGRSPWSGQVICAECDAVWHLNVENPPTAPRCTCGANLVGARRNGPSDLRNVLHRSPRPADELMHISKKEASVLNTTKRKLYTLWSWIVIYWIYLRALRERFRPMTKDGRPKPNTCASCGYPTASSTICIACACKP